MTEASAEAQAVAERRARAGRALDLAERFGLVGLLALTVLFFSFYGPTAPVYATWLNFRTIVADESVLALLALAAIVPLIGGSFDLSIASVMLLGDVVAAATLSHHGAPLAVAVVVALAIGAAVGLVNGLVVTRGRVNSLIATLGTSYVIAGIVQWYTGGESIVAGIPESLTRIVTDRWFGVPWIAMVMIAAAVVLSYLLAHTPYGRNLQAVGSNPAAARLVGIDCDRVVVTSFVFSGTFAALAGVLELAHDGSANPQIGANLLLPALAAAFLGATTIHPGRYNVPGTIVAVFFIAASIQGLTYAGVDPWIEYVFNGVALVSAVLVTSLAGRRSARLRPH